MLPMSRSFNRTTELENTESRTAGNTTASRSSDESEALLLISISKIQFNYREDAVEGERQVKEAPHSLHNKHVSSASRNSVQ